MKKVVLTALLISGLFIACKKDRTCSCTITKTGNSSTQASADIFGLPLADTSFITPVYETLPADIKYKKVTKRQAKANCISYEEPYSDNTLTSVPASSINLNIRISSTGTRKYDCKLK